MPARQICILANVILSSLEKDELEKDTGIKNLPKHQCQAPPTHLTTIH